MFDLNLLTFPAQVLTLLRGLPWFPMAPGLTVLSHPPFFWPVWVPWEAPDLSGSGLVCWVLQALPNCQEEATNANYGTRE